MCSLSRCAWRIPPPPRRRVEGPRRRCESGRSLLLAPASRRRRRRRNLLEGYGIRVTEVPCAARWVEDTAENGTCPHALPAGWLGCWCMQAIEGWRRVVDRLQQETVGFLSSLPPSWDGARGRFRLSPGQATNLRPSLRTSAMTKGRCWRPGCTTQTPRRLASVALELLPRCQLLKKLEGHLRTPIGRVPASPRRAGLLGTAGQRQFNPSTWAIDKSQWTHDICNRTKLGRNG